MTPARSGGALMLAADRWRVTRIVCELASLTVLVHLLRIESGSFVRVFTLATAGFVLHAMLPLRWRPSFFAALCTVAVPIAIGLDAGSVILAVGAVLLAVCHLPISFGARVSIIGVLAVLLGLMRFHAPILGLPLSVWPVLGSMFMFRLALYLHALRTNSAAFSPINGWSYFFLMPNACFPLFPIVDYQTFIRNRFDADEIAVYERGLHWIFRGLLHLLLYRLVSGWTISEIFVQGLDDVVRYVLAAVLLYLRVSGQFHVITGMLHLFGFRLPETHHLYFLASSFADYWRRINVYFRDFVLKLVYLPVFLRLRSHQLTTRLTISTLVVFAVSWVLHSWQYFWINGIPLLAWSDVTFWAAFGVLVTGSVLRDRRRRIPSVDTLPGRWSLVRARRTMVTFLAVALLWSYWTADSASTWWLALTHARYATTVQLAFVIALVAVGLIIAGFEWNTPALLLERVARESSGVAARSAVLRLTTVGGLAVVATFPLSRSVPYPARRILEQVKGETNYFGFFFPGGYYEEIAGPPEDGPGMRPDTLIPPALAEPVGIGMSRPDYLMYSLRPSHTTRLVGRRFQTNEWGMRDRRYPLRKDPTTYRIAVIGASDALGWGVDDDSTFDAVIESQLNSPASGRRPSQIEVLNFSVGGWSLQQRVLAIRLLAARFRPDLVVVVVNPYELLMTQRAEARNRTRGALVPAPEVTTLMSAALRASANQREHLLELRKREPELYRTTFAWAREESVRAGATLQVLLLSGPHLPRFGALPALKRAASVLGVPTLDCSEIWQGRDQATLVVSNLDRHPNGEGHRLIAHCIAAEWQTRPPWLTDAQQTNRK